RLEQLPIVPAVPHARGTVLVVVGPRAGAIEVARNMALDVRTHPRDVVVIGPRSNVEAVETERLGWRRRLDPTVVVVDAPVRMADDHYWARDVIAALEPHIVWGVVDGGRKLEDLAAWSE